jgi:hypothetical protein
MITQTRSWKLIDPLKQSPDKNRGKPVEELPMTICAAAICKGRARSNALVPMILTISDRMFTAGDLEFEPASMDQAIQKQKMLAAKIICLFSGDRDLHNMVANLTERKVDADNIVDVAHVADLYAENFITLRRKRAEQKYLAPLGLTYQSFLERLNESNSGIIENLTQRLFDERLNVDAIIAGIDQYGPHIYTVGREGQDGACSPICHDDRGYVAIGTGLRHFENEFALNGYSTDSDVFGAMWSLLRAKKKSEVAPGVGTKTDVILVGDRLLRWNDEQLAMFLDGIKEFEVKSKAIRNEILARIRREYPKDET